MLMPFSQMIQPHQLGDDASKGTCLWLDGRLPPRQPTLSVPPRWVDGKRRWSNQTPGGSNNLPPDRPGNEGARAKLRSQTFQGIGEAMANQWGAAIHPDYDEIDVFLGLLLVA